MRVSIVATALDGQQPESKSVINMVHRIQNRNPGYYESSTTQKNVNFTNSHSNFIQSTSGANALKVNNDEIKETENELINSMVDENMVLSGLSTDETGENNNSPIVDEEAPLNLEENTKFDQNNFDNENSNGLENFVLQDEGPQLFNTDREIENETIEENSISESDEDELEIPAFLRRQKN